MKNFNLFISFSLFILFFILLSGCESVQFTRFDESARSDFVAENREVTLLIKNLAGNLFGTKFILDICENSQCNVAANHKILEAAMNDTIDANGIPLLLKEKISYYIVGLILDSAGTAKYRGQISNYMVDVSKPVIELVMSETQAAIDVNQFKNVFPVIKGVTFTDNTVNGIYERNGTVDAYDPNGKALTYTYNLTDNAGKILQTTSTNIASKTFQLSASGSYSYQVKVSNGNFSTFSEYPFAIEAFKATFNLVPTLSILFPGQNAAYPKGSKVVFEFGLSDDNVNLCADPSIVKILEIYDPLTNKAELITLDNACKYSVILPSFISTYTYTFIYYDKYSSYDIANVTVRTY